MLINLIIHSHTLSNKKENYSKKKKKRHKTPKNKEIL